MIELLQPRSSLSLYLYFLAAIEKKTKQIVATTKINGKNPKPQLVTERYSSMYLLCQICFNVKGSKEKELNKF